MDLEIDDDPVNKLTTMIEEKLAMLKGHNNSLTEKQILSLKMSEDLFNELNPKIHSVIKLDSSDSLRLNLVWMVIKNL